MGLTKGHTYKTVTKGFLELRNQSGLDSIIFELSLRETYENDIKLLFALTHLSTGGILYINLGKSNFPIFASLCQRLLRCQAELIENDGKRYLKIVRNNER